MARKRSPARDNARAIWERDKTRTLKSIAEELGVDEGRVRKWKHEDAWEKGNAQKERTQKAKKERTFTREIDKKLVASMEQNEELNDKQRAFCLFYVRTYNATTAYQKAYNCTRETAHTNCSRLFQLPAVRDEIKRLKEIKALEIMADAGDVLALHMKIAFSDITDFVEFGRVTVPVMGAFGPVKIKTDDGESVELTKEINEVRFLESSEVDGQVIAKVKQGRDGASVELADKQKSLAFLERYFELNPLDAHRKAYDNARLELERRKQGDGEEIEDDGLIEALNASTKEVWNNAESGDNPV